MDMRLIYSYTSTIRVTDVQRLRARVSNLLKCLATHTAGPFEDWVFGAFSPGSYRQVKHYVIWFLI